MYRVIKQNSDIFDDFFLTSFNQSIANSIFYLVLKRRFLNYLFFNNFQILWSCCSQNTNLGSEKDIAQEILFGVPQGSIF